MLIKFYILRACQCRQCVRPKCWLILNWNCIKQKSSELISWAPLQSWHAWGIASHRKLWDVINYPVLHLRWSVLSNYPLGSCQYKQTYHLTRKRDKNSGHQYLIPFYFSPESGFSIWNVLEFIIFLKEYFYNIPCWCWVTRWSTYH